MKELNVKLQFPSHWVEKKLNRFRQQCYNTKNKTVTNNKPTLYTWAMAYDKAKARLKFNVNKLPKTEDVWADAISASINKINNYDSKGWEIKEYQILEKVNSRAFYKSEFPSILWSYKASLQVKKIKMRNKFITTRPRKVRTDKTSWNQVICNSIIKINNRKAPFSVYTSWDLCIDASLEKMRNRFRLSNSWEYCIKENIRKLNRME